MKVKSNATKQKEGESLTDIEALKNVIKDSGMTMVAIASKSGILRETLYNRLHGVGEFTASEIVALTRVLHLSKRERDKIFLMKS